MKPLDQYNYDDAGATSSPLTNADVASAGMTDQERSLFRRMQAQLEMLERELSRAKNRIRELDTKVELTTQRINR